MTVRDLINILQTMPEDLPVIVGCGDIENVCVVDEYYFGDSANPDCETGFAVEIS